MNMQKYFFQSSRGDWALHFPNDDFAIKHARLNKARVIRTDMFGEVILGEYVSDNGISYFKEYNHENL